MLAIRDRETDELQIVADLAGYPEERFERMPVTAEGIVDPTRLRLIDGVVQLDIDVERRRRWDAVKAARDAAEWAGCDTALGRVGSDPDSQRKTAGAVQMAMLAQGTGQPFEIAWTMADNDEVTHDAAAMIAMGIALGRHVAACHAIGTGLRARLAAATTVEELEAVAWPV